MKMTEQKYIIKKELGRGASGRVWLAEDVRLHRLWAIKEIRAGKDNGARRAADRALAEARLLAALQHPAIPRVVDIRSGGDVHRDIRFGGDVHRDIRSGGDARLDIRADGDAYLVIMDYVAGEPLRDYLARRGALPDAEVLHYAREICDVLLYLHGLDPPVIYRDLKPANLIRGPDGALRLIDFDTARAAPEGMIRESMPRGTRGYAAPEQYRGRSDARSDLYAFGVILEQMLTGREPSDADRRPAGRAEHPARGQPHDRSQLPRDGHHDGAHLPRGELREGLRAIARRARARDPDRRYPDAASLAADLTRPGHCSARYRLRRRRGMRIFAALLITSAILFIGGIFFRALSQYTIEQTCAFLITQYEEAGVFDETRAERLAQSMEQRDPASGPASGETAALLYRTARLYWYVYSGGDDTARTRILQAQPWFDRLAEVCGKLPPEQWPCSRAALAGYRTIADFYARYATDPGIVAEPERENLQALLDAIAATCADLDAVGAHERLGFLQSLLRLVRTHRIGFAATGVDQEEVEDAVGQIRTAAEETRPGRIETERLQREVMREADALRTSVAHGYGSLEKEQGSTRIRTP